jgi:exosortase H (IPTLxxWG-CTERM-specific)
MQRFFAIFMVVLLILFTLEMQVAVQKAFVAPLTTWLASASAWMIGLFDAGVVASGRILMDSETQFAVSIEAGCNGVEACLVLIAAVVAFPAGWKQRAVALVLGVVAVQAINLLRIISLFYLGQWQESVFLWTHLYLWPVLIMLDVLLVFVLYLRWLQAPTPQQA